MAEYYNTRYIAKDMREYVKAESRRIRLSGVRAKVTVLSTGTPGPLSCLKAFSWADITCVIKKVRGDMQHWKNAVESAVNDENIHGIIITGNFKSDCERQTVCNMMTAEKDIMCSGALAVASALRCEKNAHIPAMAVAVMQMLRYNDIEYCGKRIMLFGSGNTVRMLGFMLMNAGACVSICASASKCAQKAAADADIIITKQDAPNTINFSFMKEGQIIVDLGKNTGANGKPTGDVVFRDAEKFVRGIYIDEDNSFSDLTDYILCDHILKNAAAALKAKQCATESV